MKILLRTLFVMGIANVAFAVPRFALMEDVNCASCHSFQGGGAGRTSYGKDYATESLVMKDIAYPWVNSESELPVYFGVDARYEIVGNEGEDLRHFPMQLTAYAAGEFGNIIPHLEVSRIIDEYRVTGGVRFEGLPMESSLSLARELPILGWRIDDHTLFSRGGNFVPVGLEREGMPFTPFIEPPDMLEITSMPIDGLELILMAGSPFVNQNEALKGDYFSALKLNYTFYFDLFSAQAGVAYLQEGDLHTEVATWSILSNGIVLLGELSRISNWPRAELTNQALLHQLSYRVIQGVDLVGRYEYFDQDIEWQTGSLQRSTLGVEIFPIPSFEVKLGYRISQVDLPGEASESTGQFIGQLHFYI